MSINAGHYYDINGEPRHFVEKKAGGLRPTTIADARKNNWLPSVTTVLGCLDKPALTAWKVRNAIDAALTTPRLDGETEDAFAERILASDVNSVSDAAKALGTTVHDAIENILNGVQVGMTEQVGACVIPVINAVNQLGSVMFTERTLVGQGYAGRTDCVVENDEFITVIDFKTTGAKKLPKESYPEHKFQLSAYGKALGNTGNKRIRTANIYISTARPGEISVCINDEWLEDAETFMVVLNLWQRVNKYQPIQ